MAYMGSIQVSYQSRYRDESGRFVSECDAAATRSALELAEDVANLAKVYAPRRTGRLAGSIRGYLISATVGEAVAEAPYARAQESGASAHSIGEPGQRLASKEENFFARGPVIHPGNPAVRFMARAGQAVAALSAGTIRKHFPGT